jgi:hypothetical protein
VKQVRSCGERVFGVRRAHGDLGRRFGQAGVVEQRGRDFSAIGEAALPELANRHGQSFLMCSAHARRSAVVRIGDWSFAADFTSAGYIAAATELLVRCCCLGSDTWLRRCGYRASAADGLRWVIAFLLRRRPGIHARRIR